MPHDVKAKKIDAPDDRCLNAAAYCDARVIVRAKGILLEIRARLPLAVRKSLDLSGRDLVLTTPESSKDKSPPPRQSLPTRSKASKAWL